LESDQHATPGQVSAWFYRFAFYGYLSALGYETPVLWTPMSRVGAEPSVKTE